MKERKIFPAVLTIAGSDSGGGAGIQADLRTFSAFKVYGCSVITAVTSQNPDEVRRVDVMPGGAVTSQLETVLDAIPVRVAKTGLLANSEIIECVARSVAERGLLLVVDPVMVSTSGSQLLESSAVSAMKELLFPLAKWLTPNIPEAELLCGMKRDPATGLADAAKMLYERYGCNVILKSGHAADTGYATDIICCDGRLFTVSSPRLALAGNSAHGTGCTLSAAFAANLALGRDWESAIVESKAFVYGSLAEKVRLSDTIDQMYPPSGSYLDRIIFKAKK